MVDRPFWKVISSRKRLIRPDLLARAAGVHLAIAKAFLDNSAPVREREWWRLVDAADKIFPAFGRSVVPSRWWIRQWAERAECSAQELAGILGKSPRAIKRWFHGNEADLLPLDANDIEKLNARFPIQLAPANRIS